jgi:hypothetical protein
MSMVGAPGMVCRTCFHQKAVPKEVFLMKHVSIVSRAKPRNIPHEASAIGSTIQIISSILSATATGVGIVLSILSAVKNPAGTSSA